MILSKELCKIFRIKALVYDIRYDKYGLTQAIDEFNQVYSFAISSKRGKDYALTRKVYSNDSLSNEKLRTAGFYVTGNADYFLTSDDADKLISSLEEKIQVYKGITNLISNDQSKLAIYRKHFSDTMHFPGLDVFDMELIDKLVVSDNGHFSVDGVPV